MKKSTIGKLAVFLLLLTGMIAGAVGMSTTASAIKAENVNVDYINETITVTVGENSDQIIYFTENYNKDVSKWDACEVRNGKAVFDISWVNENKTVRLYLCGDVNKDVISVDITWEEDFNVEFTGTLLTTDITEAYTWQQVYKKYPNFSEDTGYFIFTLAENGRDMSYFNLENVEWRKGTDGVWRKYSELDLREMNIRGISLEFRIIANKNDRASSTADITVSKLSSAPAIIVNPDTMTVGIKNKMEFSFDKEEWILVPEYSKKFGTENYLVTETEREAAISEIYTKERITSILMQELLKTQAPEFTMNTPMSKDSLTKDYADVFDFTEKGIVLYVREIGTARKAASKIAEIVIPYAPDKMASADSEALEFSYGESKTNTGGIVVENKSEYKYQVGVITAEEWAQIKDTQDIDLSGMKWTSIKGGKMLKISNKKVPKGAYLIYRIAGEDGQLPSTYKIYGPMEYNELTYVGIANAKAVAGQTLTAAVSTNFTAKADGTYEGLTFQWQRCADVKAAEPKWEDIPGATKPTYELTNEEANQYIRVKVTNKVSVSGEQKEIVMCSDHEGPVKYVEPPKPEENEGTGTGENTGKQ